MGKVGEWLGVIVGGTFYIGIMIFMLLSLPFSVIALMRWFEFSWWGALLLLVGLNFIPIAGWIAYVILAMAGCYFFVTDGFSFERASTPPQFTSISRAEPRSFRCQHQSLPEFTLGEKSNPTNEQVEQLCQCIWNKLGSWEKRVATSLSKNENPTGPLPSPELNVLAFGPRFNEAVTKCGGYNL